ncbi:membrane-anchored junction protein [Pristis pectinata]|uniref:membrane-anchored junction protein n=1 Tax=Pristis pectinata TaxID=685728 RepID=UPI00223CF475|nr:membrane-anchored junction protein [Pristis pectinata]
MEVNVRPSAPSLGRAPRNGLMALKAFTYPLPETRFIHAGGTVYKLKMRYSHHIREDLGINREQVGQELEDSIRAVLGNLDNLQPFTTAHFTIFPYKNKWERLSELRFKQGNKVLISYPYVCTLYIELRSDRQHSFAAKPVEPKRNHSAPSHSAARSERCPLVMAVFFDCSRATD